MEIKLRKLFTFLIVVFPIIGQYSTLIPGISIGDFSLIILVPLLVNDIIKKNKKININEIPKNPFFWFILYIIFGSLISISIQFYSDYTAVLVRSIRYIFYIMVATFFSKYYFDFNYFIKWYKKIVVFIVLYLFLQIILFNINGTILMGTIPGLKINNPFYSDEIMKNLYTSFHRPSSIFLEPGYFPQYTLPYLAYLLFEKKTKQNKSYLMAAILTIAIVFTTSGQGIILSFLIWSFWLLSKFYSFKTHRLNIKFILIIICFFLLIPIIINTPLVSKSLGRLFGSSASSSSSRVYRGFYVYKELDWIYKIIGVGYGNVGAHLIHNQIYTIFDTNGIISEYMSSISYILVNLGIIGFNLLLWIYIHLWKDTKKFTRICVFILIVLSGVSTYFISSGIMFYLPIILNDFEKKNYKKICN